MTEDREKLGLALCPFCGGPARFGKCVPGEQEGENDGAEYVECCDCGASTCLVFPLMDSAKQVLRDRWNRRTDARHEPPNAAADYIDGPASGYAAEHSYTEPSPMAKVAAALRQKAEQEDAAYQARRSDQGLMESEWGPMEDAPPHEDPPMHVAVVEGDDAVRTLQWNRDVAAFAYPVGTLLYAARIAKEGGA